MTREQVIAWVREHSGCTTAQVAEGLGITTHNANQHLSRAAAEDDPQIVQATQRSPYTWHAVLRASPDVPLNQKDAAARLADIAARRADLDREERAVRAFFVAWQEGR